MSTPTSSAMAAAALLGLSACDEPPILTGQAPGALGQPVAALRVSENEVVVRGPAGYCIDRSTAQERPAGSFVMLGSCSILRGGDAPEAPGVLTALISPPSDPPQRPTPRQLARFFGSRDGRAALAHDGDPGSVSLLASEERGEVLVLKLRDTSASRPEALDETSWRAIFPLSDRLVVLSVTAHRDRPIGETEARATLDRFVEAMQAANAQVVPGGAD